MLGVRKLRKSQRLSKGEFRWLASATAKESPGFSLEQLSIKQLFVQFKHLVSR